MRCLYCGIRLKITDKALLIEHCPECSLRIECERPGEALAGAMERKSRMPAEARPKRSLSLAAPRGA